MDWLNYTLLFERDRQVKEIRLREKLAIQRAILTGVMFHDTEKGFEMRDNMIATLDGEDVDDTNWISDPQSKTDLATLEKILQRRVDERRRERESGTPPGGSGDDAPGTRADDTGDPPDDGTRVRTVGLGF